ncbi:hypothetical protein PAXRUDRAFT_25237 [Paxillus rubicundulus Ve08.2h10]|uniref:Uncharacterized protein n=1 Tax=Paxillus rubicundulus Ve08.2h10 TaxID=930991 RepID=A0A0D0DZP3_9AGAM|nr:hypothetical protein PAXRUDRAFT_25237 [Paxillus rubicundulus Ve08.2h10]
MTATTAKGLIKVLGLFLMKLTMKASQPAVVTNGITTPSSEAPQTQPSLNEIQLSTPAVQNTGAAGAEGLGFRVAHFGGGHTPDHSIFQLNFNFDLDTFNPNLDKLFCNLDGEYGSFQDFSSSNDFI